MKCVICQSNTIQNKEVNEEIHHESDIYIIELTVPVCTQCGERYYSRKDIQLLEKQRELIEQGKIKTKKAGDIKKVEPA